MSKIKLLIVNGSMAQAGTERWFYEICKHLNKDKFEVGVVCYQRYAKTSREQTFDNYYYHELKKLNVNLYENYPDYADTPPLWDRGIGKIRRTIRKVTGNREPIINRSITKLFRDYDVVCIVDFLNYKLLRNEIEQIPNLKFFIPLLCRKFQFQFDPYTVFDQDKKHNIVYFCQKQVDDLEESGFNIEKNQLFHFPLIMDFSGYPYIFNPMIGDSATISHFARISFMRPIDVFIKAFARLRECSPINWNFNIYGEIQDEDYYEQLKKLIKELKIDENSIHFMGHSNDIAETIRKDKVNIYWGMCTDTTLGFSSIQVNALGVPSFFWSYGDPNIASSRIAELTGNAIIPYERIEDFVNATLKCAANNEALAELSVRQRDYLIRSHDAGGNIENFEKYVASFANRSAAETT